jgi:hypothetical protein
VGCSLTTVREICLYDSLSGELVPVSAGDAIRVEVRGLPSGVDGCVDVESTRPLVLFGFLERFLRREGFATKFLFDSPDDEDTLYELAEEREAPETPVSGGDGDDGEHDAERDGEQDGEMGLLEVQRSDVEQWVNVCFGTGREGVEHISARVGEPILLSRALEEFGHSAVALYLLGTHYSLPLGDAHAGLIAGSRNESSIRKALERLVPDQPSPPDMRHYVEDFRDALADDLDTPTAFVVMFEWLLEAERRGCDVGDNDLRVMLEVFELEHLAEPTAVR